MSKKKRIIIGIIIVGVIIISSIIGISVYHSKNTESINDGESSTNSTQENTITNTNEIINTDTVNDIQENVIVDEQLEENKTNDIIICVRRNVLLIAKSKMRCGKAVEIEYRGKEENM